MSPPRWQRRTSFLGPPPGAESHTPFRMSMACAGWCEVLADTSYCISLMVFFPPPPARRTFFFGEGDCLVEDATGPLVSRRSLFFLLSCERLLVEPFFFRTSPALRGRCLAILNFGEGARGKSFFVSSDFFPNHLIFPKERLLFPSRAFLVRW